MPEVVTCWHPTMESCLDSYPRVPVVYEEWHNGVRLVSLDLMGLVCTMQLRTIS